ncbi:MAG: tRNA (N6-isopentenyl adenosine(37)-C2)-methylthiotransferase MiaB [Deltaproteobacteria bacterium GWC2_42_51]|nr:MAG: tRNA (N6-isopentenyl adenosine(37)-C2)-methylthiotransferase MiaB [Deltaproteobacteria bacterium GWA2_42_85]OGP36406.1 MAG: tRNA (N6-isopentenyl adenosine(37)-C2)-methylthiotransferase MiaB [Deltaproteobacteria bacterium GWC2_42_51]OGP42942.1 MAG: tRNA (N6-isopentenyl adenosine(37)-C2)-methylthiotransferase MiaB [Deltaproteobacteria bacterium GWD2_42_10]OGQ28753.1 MAG: tRNA (N6-isopentenyl adenosine(37)-C2)-methylthiotransferase MiaB [Deltaproteobacteria bacterium RIFCSPHIGHO2_02_FULL_42
MEIQVDKQEKYIFIETFGCQMNENDSERIASVLKGMNYRVTDTIDKADMIILNTCSIRDKAEQKVYSALGRLKKIKLNKPNLIVGVGGCVAQQEGEKLLKRAPHLDVVFGTHNIHRLPTLIKEVNIKKNRIAATDFYNSIEDSFSDVYADDSLTDESKRVKSFVAVMRGCDNFCSYCIVPYVRGRELSRRSKDVLADVNRLAESGIKEVTLVGQNVNSYGNKNQDISFSELLQTVCKVNGIERVRFITSHPKDLSEELINLFGDEEKLCRHIHLPVQSGANIVLERMSRGYSREDYLNKIYKLKQLYPDIGITTDVIVGFPGENESQFLETMSLVKEVEFDNIFSFKYSPRPETKAAAFGDQIPDSVKEERLRILQDAQREITLSKNKAMVGKIVDVLIEGRSKVAKVKKGTNNNQFTGRTSCNKVVNILEQSFGLTDEDIGKILQVRVERASYNSLLGVVENQMHFSG